MTAVAMLSRLRAGVIAAGCALLVSSCAPATAAQPALKVPDVVGTWSNHDSSTITFHTDGSFRAVRMDMGPALEGCGSVTGTGNWDFLSPQGNSAASGVTYDSGNQIE